LEGFSYSGDPSTSPKDAVRFEITDTVEESAFLKDAEIEYSLRVEAGEEPDARGVLCASARCAEVIARSIGKQADEIVGSLGATYSKTQYQKLAKELRKRAQGLGAPRMPAISRSEKRRLRQDRERVQPLFRRDQHKMHRFGHGTLNGGGTIEEDEGEEGC
jgi:hypothetical protein